MKENKLSKEEIRELEEMARIGKESFSGDLDKVEQAIHDRIDGLVPTQVEKPSSGNMKRLVIAALVLLCIVLLALYLTKQNKPQPALEYATAYYETPPFVLAQENRGDETVDKALTSVNDAYKAKDFAKVLMLTKDPSDAEATFYHSIALFELGRLNEAIASLEQHKTTDLEDMRTWYLALGYLKTNDLSSARSELAKIAKSKEHYKQGQAIELLEKMGAE